MDYTELLQHYKKDLSKDCDLVKEAITTLESYFEYMDWNELAHYSRPLAIAYLALKDIDNKRRIDIVK